MRAFKLSLAAAIMVTLGVAGSAYAGFTRSTAAIIGKPAEGASPSLFVSHLGAVTYNGANYAWWEIPLVTDPQQQGSIYEFETEVTGLAPSPGALSCANRSVSGDGLTFTGTALMQAPVVGSVVTWGPGPIYVYPWQSGVVDCLMGTGSMVSNVLYTP